MKKTKAKSKKNKKKKKRGLGSTIALVVIFLIGLCVLLYPSVSNFINEKRQSQAIINYDSLLQNLTPEDLSEYFRQADEYNTML